MSFAGYDHWKTTEPENDEPVECPDCGGHGGFMRVEPDCCGLVHELGYCRGDCAIPRETQEPCPACGGTGWLGLAKDTRS